MRYLILRSWTEDDEDMWEIIDEPMWEIIDEFDSVLDVTNYIKRNPADKQHGKDSKYSIYLKIRNAV